jgi:hypothetical protein
MDKMASKQQTNPALSQQPSVVFQYYQPPKPKPPQKPFEMSHFMPVYNPGIGMPPQFQYMMPPIIKNIQINTSGPTDNHQRLMMINEDVLPKKGEFIPSATTVEDRLNIYQFIRSSIFNNVDGKDMGLAGTDSKSLLSYIKFGELNPYNTYKYSLNPYKGLPYGFLIYRSCYPIRHSESGGSVICAKDSTAINVRIYRLTEGSYARLKTADATINYYNYDEWREVIFYEYIREFILKKKVCPHFLMLYGYFICEKSNIDFDYNYLIKKSETHDREQKYVLLPDNVIAPETFEEMKARKEREILQKQKDKHNAITHPPTIMQILSKKPLIPPPIEQFARNTRSRTIFEPETAEDIKDRITRLKGNIASGKIKPLSKELWEIEKKSKQVCKINPKAYLGKAVVLLTESPTYSLFAWASRTYS